MCGICGIYGIEDKALIERMLSVLKHRGPDDRGIYRDSNISMGHARLSIIDLTEKGRQPMPNEDGDIWLSVNGEIYNFMKLRAELEKKGHRFYSNSDSEAIVHTYEEYGLDFVNKLRGMFALALYDKTKRRLVLARDPIGKKPLYYYFDGQKLIFASEIKAILEAGIKREIDQNALCSYLAYQYTLGERTLFKDIKKVLPGNMLILEQGKLNIQRYWDINENPIHASENYFINKLRALLEESTRLRMVADVPVGAFLSGGIDSSAIVALARPHVESEFHTFSVGFETFSEQEYAKIVSQHLDTVHHELIITADMVVKNLPKIAWHYDEPLGDAAIINNYYLSREARRYVKVVLAGEGGDELFAGYPNYRRNLKIYYILKIPLLKFIAKTLMNVLPDGSTINSSNKLKQIKRYAKFFMDSSLESVHLNTTRTMSDDEIIEISNLTPFNINSFAVYPQNLQSALGKMQAVDCKNLLPEKFLMKADKGTMANSIEERLPLLDKEIIEFAFSIPPRFKIKKGLEKYILRRAVEDLLPKEIINRPKKGFGTTVGHWMENELGELVSQKLSQGELLKEILKPEQRQALLKGLDKGFERYPFKIWTIFALELWYETYFLK
jgi:asparagine synthase (glutamine-hydrolysing)